MLADFYNLSNNCRCMKLSVRFIELQLVAFLFFGRRFAVFEINLEKFTPLSSL